MHAAGAVHQCGSPLKEAECCPAMPLPPPPTPTPLAQLYSHHVLAQLAADADEAAGASAKRTRTLPSFWAAKAALERQQRQPNGWHAGGGGGGGQGEGVGAAPREGKRRRTEEGQQAGGEEGRKAASPSPSDFRCGGRAVSLCTQPRPSIPCRSTKRRSPAFASD
jgi:hypothetical protein